MRHINEDFKKIHNIYEIKYIENFDSIIDIKKEVYKLKKSGYTYLGYSVKLPNKKIINADQFEKFSFGKIKGNERLRFGDSLHISINKAYGFMLGNIYLDFENIKWDNKLEQKIIKDNFQLKLF